MNGPGFIQSEFAPTLAVTRALRSEEVQQLTKILPYGLSHKQASRGYALRENTLFSSSFGANALNHAVSSWSDEKNRTVFAFEPDGLIKQVTLHKDGVLRLPSEAEAFEALDKIGTAITRLMREHFNTQVMCEPELIPNNHC